MSEQFQYDVFLSHSAQDKPAARELAERLRRDGLRVWFDEWEIKPGDGIETTKSLPPLCSRLAQPLAIRRIYIDKQ